MKHKTKKPNILERVGHLNIAFDGRNYQILQPKKPISGIGKGFINRDAAVLFAQGKVESEDQMRKKTQYEKMSGTWTERKVHNQCKKAQHLIDEAEDRMIYALGFIRK